MYIAGIFESVILPKPKDVYCSPICVEVLSPDRLIFGQFNKLNNKFIANQKTSLG